MSALCVMGARCATFDRRTGIPARSYGWALCEDCERAAHFDVSLLRYDFVDLSQVIARTETPSQVKISRPKPGSTPPIDLDVDELLTAIVDALWIWEQPVRWAAGLPPRGESAARAGWRVDHAVRVIAPRVQILAALPEVGAYHHGRDQPMVWVDGLTGLTRLRDLHTATRRHTGLVVKNLGLPGECRNCKVHALYRRDGTDTVSCGNCKKSWTYEDYSRYVRLMIADPGAAT